MQLTESHIIKDDRFKDWCKKAKELYNTCLYFYRQSLFGKIKKFTEYELSGLLAEYDDPNFRALPANTSQQIIKFLFANIKSWKKSVSEYNKNPSKFKGIPKLPKYKKELSELYFTKEQARLKNGYVRFPKMLNVPSIQTKITNLKLCRVTPKSNHFTVEFIYDIEEKEILHTNNKFLSVDLGLNNLAACSSNDINSFIINGKPLKSINEYYNKKKSKLQSFIGDKGTSKKIRNLNSKRNNKVKDYLHKASKKLITISSENNITKIIIGINRQWKQNINIGKDNNRKFTTIPHATFIDIIKYKAKIKGIEVIETQEAYTSKCSALDLEPICKHKSYVGKRIKRGLFKTEKGKLINADINGSLNIARLVLGDVCINQPIERLAVNPYKITNFI